MSAVSALVQLRGVSKTFGAAAALHSTDLAFERGKTTALIGPSGCGKSTLLRLIIGLLEPDGGKIEFDGTPIAATNFANLRRRIGYVIQDGGLFPHLTARKNVLLMPAYLNRPASEMNHRLEELCALTRFPEDALDRYPIEQRGKIMAVWSAVIMLGPILGPTLGGFLTDNYSWRWVFYVNVPIGILCALGVFFFLFEDKLKAPPEFDWYGFAFLSIALGALQLALDRGTDQSWFDSTEIVAETVIAGLSFYLFLVHQWTTKHPFLNPDLLKDR